MYLMIDQFAAFSILLFFQGILFSHIGKGVNEFLKTSKPPEAQKVALNNWKSDKSLIVIKAICSFVFCFLVWYVSLPEAYGILSSTTINLIDFDTLKTSFVVISFSLFSMTMIMMYWIVQTIRK